MVVVPGLKPATTPDVLTVPTVVLELLQTPPVAVVDSVVVCPWHTVAVPVMAGPAEITTVCAVDVKSGVHVPPPAQVK